MMGGGFALSVGSLVSGGGKHPKELTKVICLGLKTGSFVADAGCQLGNFAHCPVDHPR